MKTLEIPEEIKDDITSELKTNVATKLGNQIAKKAKLKFETVSACIITGNEEDLIEDCIASIVQWVDEIVLVDTGVTDKTLERAKLVGGDKLKIYEHTWDEDFSAARNFSISKATQDWIFIIDTDERVLHGHGENILKMLPNIKQDVIVVNVANLYWDGDAKRRIPKAVLPSLRFFRSSYGIEYEQAVHNQPVIKPKTVFVRIPFTINHLGYDLSPEKMSEKYERTVRMCTKLTKDNPDDPFSWFHLSRALKIKDGTLNKPALKEVFSCIEKGLELCDGKNDNQNIYIQLLSAMAWMKYAAMKPVEAVEYGKKAYEIKNNFLDAILVIGLAYSTGINAIEGEPWLKLYLEEQENYNFSDKVDSITMEHADDRVLVYRVLIDIENMKHQYEMSSITALPPADRQTHKAEDIL